MSKHVNHLNNTKANENVSPVKACGWWATDKCGTDGDGCGNWANDCCLSDGGACGWGSYDCTDSNG